MAILFQREALVQFASFFWTVDLYAKFQQISVPHCCGIPYHSLGLHDWAANTTAAWLTQSQLRIQLRFSTIFQSSTNTVA